MPDAGRSGAWIEQRRAEPSGVLGTGDNGHNLWVWISILDDYICCACKEVQHGKHTVKGWKNEILTETLGRYAMAKRCAGIENRLFFGLDWLGVNVRVCMHGAASGSSPLRKWTHSFPPISWIGTTLRDWTVSLVLAFYLATFVLVFVYHSVSLLAGKYSYAHSHTTPFQHMLHAFELVLVAGSCVDARTRS